MSTRTKFSAAMLAVIAGLEKLPKSYVLRRTTFIDNDPKAGKVDVGGMIWFTNKSAEACEYYEDRTCQPGTICLLEAVAHHQKKGANGHVHAGRALGLTNAELGNVVDVADDGRARVRTRTAFHRSLYRAFNKALRRRAERIGVAYVS